MRLSKNATGYLIARYCAVLRKCRLLNIAGGIALGAMLAVGGAGLAQADTQIDTWSGDTNSLTSFLGTGDANAEGTLSTSLSQGGESKITLSSTTAKTVHMAGYSIAGDESEQGIRPFAIFSG